METLEKIKMDGAGFIDKLRRGETLTEDEKYVVKIYNSLYAGKAGNAEKRKVIKTGR